MNKTKYIILTIVLCFSLAFVAYPSRTFAGVNGSGEPGYDPSEDVSTPIDDSDTVAPWHFGNIVCITCRLINDTAVKEGDLVDRPLAFMAEFGDTFEGSSSGTTYVYQKPTSQPPLGSNAVYVGEWVPVSGGGGGSGGSYGWNCPCNGVTDQCNRARGGTYTTEALCEAKCPCGTNLICRHPKTTIFGADADAYYCKYADSNWYEVNPGNKCSILNAVCPAPVTQTYSWVECSADGKCNLEKTSNNPAPAGTKTCHHDTDCTTTVTSCSVTATATSNPIPTGQSQTIISATSLSHTSLTKCKVDIYSLPHPYTQTASSKIYTVNCTGNSGYNNCSDDIRVTKQGMPPPPAPTTRYSCNNSTWSCFENPNSIYTLDECRIVCQPGGILSCPGNDYCYACNKTTYQCYHINSGTYSTLSGCQDHCQQPPLSSNCTYTVCENGINVTKTGTIPCPVDTPCSNSSNCNYIVCENGIDVPKTGTIPCPVNNFCPLPCRIDSFTINGKCNIDSNYCQKQDPLIVWVNASLTGYFSVSDTCETCTVKATPINGGWNGIYPISTSHSSITTPPFKITTAGTYKYTLTCEGADGIGDEDTLSLKTVKALNLPWWREIIPNLTGFLRGMIR